MARVKVTHDGFNSDEAAEPPLREPLPEGKYVVFIVRVEPTTTTDHPPRARITLELQVLARIGEDGERDEASAGRRIYQHFVLEADPSKPGLSEQRRYELRMLLDACDVPRDDEGFDTDHLLNKTVVVTTRNRAANTPDQYGRIRHFTNVVRIDSDEPIEEGDLV